MDDLLSKMIQDFFIAFGVVLGGTLLGGMAAILTLQPPSTMMDRLADHIKIWALVVAIGGTIDPIRMIETNLLGGYLSTAFRQIILILSAFFGAHFGTMLIKWITSGGSQP